MKKSVLVCLSSALLLTFAVPAFPAERREAGNLVIEGIPEIPVSVREELQRYQSVRSAYLEDWSADGKNILIATRFGETSQLHLVEHPGGARKQLTFFDEPVQGASISPDKSKGLLFSKDIGGSEFYQIFHFDLNTSKYTMLTDGKSRNGGALWSNKGDTFAFYSTMRNNKDWDIYLGNPGKPGQSTRIIQEGGFWYPVSWSPDDSKLLLKKLVAADESYLYILDIASRTLTQVNPVNKKISYGSAEWSKDSGALYFTSNEDTEFEKLRKYNITTRKQTTLTEKINWSVEDFALSNNGKFLAYTINEDGISKMKLVETAGNKEVSIPALPKGIFYALSFNRNDSELGFNINTAQTPGDIYSLNLASKELKRWTYSEVGGLDTSKFVVPELIHYPTFDKVNGKQRTIPAFYFKPKNNSGKKLPVIINIHGGPESQYRPYFSSSIQYFANEMGIAYIAPNVRGSDGYGKTYLNLDNGYKREDSVKDIGALIDWIAKQPELDADRIVVRGGSYGGYMVLASMIHYNDKLRAGLDSVGISNFVTFLENTQDYRRDLRRVEYGDERDPAMRKFLMGISPTTNANKITKPMFIVQGLNDPRVPASEAEQIVEAIRKNGGEAWYLLAKDEGHGFSKKSNSNYLTEATVMFFRKYLLE